MSAPAQAPARPGRRWPRRLAWLLALAVLARLALAFGAVPLARALAARNGIELEIEQLDLGLLHGRVELWRLEAAVEQPDGDATPLLAVQTLALDVDTRALLRGHLRVRRLELDGVRVELARDAAGAWNLDALLARFAGGTPAAKEPEEPYVPGPLALDPPLEVVAVRLQDASIHLRDDSVEPPLDATATLSLSAADIGSPGRRASLDLVATSPELLHLLRIRGSGTSAGPTAQLALELELASLRLRPVAHLLAPLGIEPLAARLDAGFALELHAEPCSEPAERLAAGLELRGVRLAHDGREALALDHLSVDVSEVWPRGLRVREALLEGLRARAERLPDGALALAGVAWRGAPASPAAESAAAADDAPAAPGPAREPFEWSVDALRVRAGLVAFDDRALDPALETRAELGDFRAGPVSSIAGALSSPLELSASVPGLIETLAISGTLGPFQDGAPAFELALDSAGLDLARAAPYLALAGIEPALSAGTLRVDSLALGPTADGSELSVRGLALREGERELGAIGSIALQFTPGSAPAVAVEGGRLELVREASDTYVALGLRFGAAPPAPPPAAGSPAEEATGTEAAPSPPSAPAAFRLPTLALPRVRLQLEQLLLVDQKSGAEPEPLGPFSAALTPADPADPAGRAFDLALEGRGRFVRELVTDLHLEQAPSGTLDLEGSARARGLELERLGPWLAPLGLEPALAEGSFDGRLALSLQALDGHAVLDLELGPLHLSEGAGTEPREWLGLERLTVERLELGSGVALGALRVESPRLTLQRDADGGLRALGLRRPAPAAAASGPAAEELLAAGRAEASAARTPAGSATPAEPEPGSPGPAAPSGPPMRIGRIEISGARVRLDDLALAAPHAVDLGADLRIEDLSPGAGAPPTAVEGRLALGALELLASGQLVLDPDDLRASLQLSGQGLNGAALAPYLPAGTAIDLRDGVAAARLEARYARAPEGGHSAALRVESADLRERGAERPLAALAALRAEAPRIDPAGGVLDVEELSVEGVALELLRTADGGLAALGLRFAPRPGTAENAPLEEVGGEAAAPEAPAPASEQDARPPARLRLGRLDLELAELRVASEGHAESSSRSTARLTLRAPYELTVDPEADDDNFPALGLDLAASVAPGIESVALGLDLAPFQEQPRLDFRLALRGISGAGLLALAPELAGQLDPAGLSEGSFDATVGAELAWRRRSPFDFDLRSGFGGELQVSDVALRQTPGGEVALGLDGLTLVARRISPRSGLVHLAELVLDTPRGRVRRTPEGFELAGLELRLPPDGPAAGADSTAGGPGTGEAEGPAAVPAGELRIDSILVGGIDVRFEDTRTEPPFVLPLETLDLELRGFSSRALTQPVPLRISVSVGAGDVPLPERQERKSLVRGLASGVLGAVGGSKEELKSEPRPFFQEATLSAGLTLAPYPTGWVRSSLTAFELPGLRGYAARSGVEIGDGLLDFTARAKLNGQQGARVDSVSNFSYLSLSEPAGGPISRYLRLPAPLDTVLFALQDERGEQRIPLGFDLGEGGRISAAAIAAKASAALLGLITDALAGAPMRAVGGVTDILVPSGLFGQADRQPKYAGRVETVRFAAGDAGIGAGQRKALAGLVEALRADPLLELQAVHAFGPGDQKYAERLASPDLEEADDVLRFLRRRRAELARERTELAAQARAQLLLGQSALFEATRAELIASDRELGLTEDGIDRVAQLLQPGSESRRVRRTREAALALARARMDALLRGLLDAGAPYERLDLRPPRLELAEPLDPADPGGWIQLVTRGGTPPKGFIRRILGWVGL